MTKPLKTSALALQQLGIARKLLPLLRLNDSQNENSIVLFRN